MEIKIYFHQKTFFTEKSYRVWINISHFTISDTFKRTCNSRKLKKHNCDTKTCRKENT